jgi:hypothetical protein
MPSLRHVTCYIVNSFFSRWPHLSQQVTIRHSFLPIFLTDSCASSKNITNLLWPTANKDKGQHRPVPCTLGLGGTVSPRNRWQVQGEQVQGRHLRPAVTVLSWRPSHIGFFWRTSYSKDGAAERPQVVRERRRPGRCTHRRRNLEITLLSFRASTMSCSQSLITLMPILLSCNVWRRSRCWFSTSF